LALMCLPMLVMAQDSGLIPCGYGDNPCDTGDVANFVNGLIDFLIRMLGVIAVIVLVVTGIQLVTSGGDESKWTAAKERFTNVVIGIVIILAAWLVVDTIMEALTGDGLDFWGRLTGGEYGAGTALVDGGAAGVATGQYTNAEARSTLATAGVGVNAQEPQTSLEGMNQSTVNEVIRLRQACGCDVTVTGGTESGHSTSGTYNHASGSKVDLRVNANLNNYIASNYTSSGTRSDGATLYTNGSIVYAREGDHWDITVR